MAAEMAEAPRAPPSSELAPLSLSQYPDTTLQPPKSVSYPASGAPGGLGGPSSCESSSATVPCVRDWDACASWEPEGSVAAPAPDTAPDVLCEAAAAEGGAAPPPAASASLPTLTAPEADAAVDRVR